MSVSCAASRLFVIVFARDDKHQVCQTLNVGVASASTLRKEVTVMSKQGVQIYRQRRGGGEGDGGANLSTQVTCFLLGGAVGALAALLFAPKSGRELRGDIADVTRQGVDQARVKANEYYEVSRERATELYSTASTKAGEVAGAARQAAARRGENLSAAIDAGKRAYADEKRRTESTNILNPAPTYYEPDKS